MACTYLITFSTGLIHGIKGLSITCITCGIPRYPKFHASLIHLDLNCKIIPTAWKEVKSRNTKVCQFYSFSQATRINDSKYGYPELWKAQVTIFKMKNKYSSTQYTHIHLCLWQIDIVQWEEDGVNNLPTVDHLAFFSAFSTMNTWMDTLLISA